MRQFTRREILASAGLGAVAALAPAARAARRPNVVFILADDLGWRDTSLYGSTFCETPNIDALARRGMMFTQAYAAAPICSPTRASILTGLYPARLGITVPVCHLPQVRLEETVAPKGRPDRKALECVSATRLKREYFTLAEALKEAGYATAHFGKWHLGAEPYDPLHQGFDVDIPHTSAPGPVGGYLGPFKVWPGHGEPGEHLEERMSAEASRFIREHKDRPFYLNYWCFSVHSPWNAKQALIEKYRAKADPKSGQRNPVYGAMVESMDQAVGRLMRTLDDEGVANNTIVVFFSDNGGVFWTPGDIPGFMHPEYNNLPVTSNAPLRDGKATVYEGGTREPCLVVWPGKVKAGSRSEQIVSSVDFYPTLLEATGVKPSQKPRLDGISFLPALEGKRAPRDVVFCHFPHYSGPGARPSSYVRKSDWKLIRFYFDSDEQTDRFELYNLRDDLSETKNLVAEHPDKVRELSMLLDGFLRDTGAVLPKKNPDYRPNARRGAAVFNADDLA